MFFLQANPTSSIRLDEGTKKDEMRKLEYFDLQHRSWNLAAPSSVHEEGSPVDVGQGRAQHGDGN